MLHGFYIYREALKQSFYYWYIFMVNISLQENVRDQFWLLMTNIDVGKTQRVKILR